MNEWPMVKLGEVCSISIGKTPARKELRYWGEGLPWLSIKDMNQGSLILKTTESISQIALDELKITPYSVGTVLFSFKLSIGKVGITAVPLFTNEAIAAIEPKEQESLNKYYLMEVLREVGKTVEGNAAVMGVTLNKKSLAELKIPLPPLGEQKRIAEILGGVANAIHTVEQQIETANQLEKSLFNQFRRQYSALCSPIKNICKVQTGATPSRKNSAYYDGGIPWVKTGEVNGGKIEETEEYITELAVQETNCRKFPIGTILVAMYGQGATRGKVGILNCAAATNQACAALIALACEDQEYIFAVLRNCYDELRNLGRGGTQPNLNLTLVKEFEIPWPEEFAREEFSQKWRELDNLRHLLHRKLSLLQELQKSLATRAFAGLL
jgi:type I restriction-modification system, specificity subunit